MIMTLTRELEGMKRNSISGLCGELEEATLWVSSQFFIVKITLKLSSKQRNRLERVMLYYLKVLSLATRFGMNSVCLGNILQLQKSVA